MELIEELKRRNVFRVGVAYLALAWVVIQITDMAVPALNLPQSLQAIVFYIGIVGFPFAVFFAWAFELTPDGLKREHEVDRTASVTHHTARKIDFGIIAMLVLAVAFLVVDNYVMPGPVETDTASSDSTSTPPKEETSYNSIGVLPFLNMSNDPDQEYFSDGIAEELLNALAKLKNLQVAARTSSFAFKGQNQDIMEVGSALKVDTVLEGSVRKSGTRLRITAQLIDVANGYHLWSETYEREIDDIFAIQDEISLAISQALEN
jgi:TolB-like protein